MAADVYSHIIDDDRRINAQQFEEQFYQSKAAPAAEEEAQEEIYRLPFIDWFFSELN